MNAQSHTPGQWTRCLGPYGPYVVAQSEGLDIVVAKLEVHALGYADLDNPSALCEK